MQIDFKDRTALVTGATRGIGAAIAKELGRCGANLILTGTSPDRIDALNKENEKAGIENVRYVAVDFNDESSLSSFLDQLRDGPTIDVCVNNAGINRIMPMGEVGTEDFEALNRINLRAPYLITQAVSPAMVRQEYGRIVNIASIWSVITKAQRSLYTTMKAGLIGLTRTSAVEFAPHNVLVNAVSPGFVMTELTAASLSDEEQKSLASQAPINRFAQPEEIARVVLFLASDLNTYVTGQNLVADGGFVIV